MHKKNIDLTLGRILADGQNNLDFSDLKMKYLLAIQWHLSQEEIDARLIEIFLSRGKALNKITYSLLKKINKKTKKFKKIN